METKTKTKEISCNVCGNIIGIILQKLIHPQCLDPIRGDLICYGINEDDSWAICQRCCEDIDNDKI